MSGLDVDTRTEVYALGVTVYELLVGALAEMQARKFALLGDEDRSLEWFGEAIRRGNRTLTLPRAPELAPIRRLPV
jgi:hypothetical protein